MPAPARLIVFVVLFIAGSAGISSAGVVWTDYDGDGLPDPATPFSVPAGSNVSVDIWIDAQSFNWTNYLVYVEWTEGALSFESADYVISGGANFPFNRFDQPNAVGFGGVGYDEGLRGGPVRADECRADDLGKNQRALSLEATFRVGHATDRRFASVSRREG